jgi:hypothetical protein
MNAERREHGLRWLAVVAMGVGRRLCLKKKGFKETTMAEPTSSSNTKGRGEQQKDQIRTLHTIVASCV